MPGDDEVNAFIRLGIDPGVANESLAKMRAMKDGIAGIKGEADKFGGAKEAISGMTNGLKNAASSAAEFAGNIAKAAAKVSLLAGGAAFGTAFAAASSYADKYQGVESGATDFKRAQADIARAFDNLGRVTATLLTPLLEKAADSLQTFVTLFTENLPKIKAFIQPFIDWVDTHIDLGAVAQTISRIVGIFEGGIALINRDLGNAVDGVATSLQATGIDIKYFIKGLREGLDKILDQIHDGFADFINGLLNVIPENVRKTLGINPIGHTEYKNNGPAARQDTAQGEKSALFDALGQRVAKRNKEAADVGDSLANTDARVGQTVEEIKKLFSGAHHALVESAAIDKPTLDAAIARNASLRAAQKAHDDSLTQLDTQFKATQAQIAKARTALQTEQAQAEAALTAKNNDDKLKAQTEFNDNEAKIEEQGRLKRLQDTRAHELRLSDFAANRDVLGFIREQESFKAQTQAEDEQAAAEKAARAKEKATQDAERDAQYRKDLAELQKSGRDKARALDDQAREAQQAYQTQKRLLDNKLIQENQSINDNFVQQLFNLDSHLAGMDALRDAYYARETAALQNLVSSGGLGQIAQNSSFVQRTPVSSSNVVAASNGISHNNQTNITLNATVGDVVTSRDLNSLMNALTSGMAAARSY